MIVQMLVHISGGRYDGQQWPMPGVSFEVPDEEGEALVRDRNALFVANSKSAEKSEPEPEPEPEEEPAPKSSDSEEEVLEPAPSDTKGEWVAYAVSRGANQSEAESLTKAQLQSAYGGRLLSST
jgi:hypothetical protein